MGQTAAEQGGGVARIEFQAAVEVGERLLPGLGLTVFAASDVVDAGLSVHIEAGVAEQRGEDRDQAATVLGERGGHTVAPVTDLHSPGVLTGLADGLGDSAHGGRRVFGGVQVSDSAG